MRLHRGRLRGPDQVERFLDRVPTAGLRGAGGIVSRERRSRLLDEIAARCFLGVDVHDPLLMGVDLRRRGDLDGPRGLMLDELGGSEADQREPKPANAHDIGEGSHRVEE